MIELFFESSDLNGIGALATRNMVVDILRGEFNYDYSCNWKWI